MNNNSIIAILCVAIISSCLCDVLIINNTSQIHEEMHAINANVMVEKQNPAMKPVSTNNIYNTTTITISNSTGVTIGTDLPKVDEKQDTVSEEKTDISANVLTEADTRMIALIVVGEAEGESDYGKRLVADTILNRMDSMHFPNTVTEVIHQPGQYSCVWNGRLNNCNVTDDICDLVREEAVNRSNNEVMFFRTKHYGYGKPLLQEGHHYFCGLNV